MSYIFGRSNGNLFIHCLDCTGVSFDPDHIEQLYCKSCEKHHVRKPSFKETHGLNAYENAKQGTGVVWIAHELVGEKFEASHMAVEFNLEELKICIDVLKSTQGLENSTTVAALQYLSVARKSKNGQSERMNQWRKFRDAFLNGDIV